MPKKRALEESEEEIMCTKSELCYDARPFKQVTIDKHYNIHIGPKAALSDESPLVFEISGSGEDYWDVGDMYLQLRGKITNANGDNLAQDADVGPINNLANGMFSQLDVVLNDTVISQSHGMYGYEAYLTNLLSFSPEVKKTQMYMEGWVDDEANKFNSKDNKSHKYRKKRHSLSKEFEFKFRLHTDLTFQDRLMPNHVTGRLTLTRAKNAFCLLGFAAGSTENYKITLTYASLEVRKVKVSPEYQLFIEQKILGKGGAHFPITHTVMKNFTIPQGNSTYDLDGLFLGQLPWAITLGFVRNAAFMGNYSLNPYNFQHFNLCHISLNVEGDSIPTRPLTPNYTTGRYTECYETLFKGTKMLGDNITHGVTYDKYPNGYCLYCFNLTPDDSDGVSHVSQRKTGNIRLNLRWSTALTEAVSLIVLGQMQNTLTIDSNRDIIVDYAP